jgi:hypothetical protein
MCPHTKDLHIAVLRPYCIRELSTGGSQEKPGTPEDLGVWTNPAQLVEVTRPEAAVEDVWRMRGKVPECVAEEDLRKAKAKAEARARCALAKRKEKAEIARTADQVRRGVPMSADEKGAAWCCADNEMSLEL